MAAYDVSWYAVWPTTRQAWGLGYGAMGINRMWLAKDELHRLGASFLNGDSIKTAWRNGLFETVAHEAGHNHQPMYSKPHGEKFRKAEAEARMLLWKALHKGWPKIDRRQMRESKAPAARPRNGRR
jgi:hypothetical protein